MSIGGSGSEEDLVLLRQINAIKVDGKSLSDFFAYRGVSMWSFMQGSLWSSIRRRTREVSPYEVARTRAPVSVLAALFMLGASVSALLWVLVRRPKVAIYSPDIALGPQRTDPRMGLIYDELNMRGVRYIEFIHAIPGRRMLDTWFHRRRPVIYLEALDILHTILTRVGLWRRRFPVTDWKSLAPEELESADRQFVFFMLKRYAIQAEIAAFRTDALRILFRMMRPSHLMALDDPRNYHELLMAAHSVGACSHSFQHGRFDKYFAGHIYYDIPLSLCVTPDIFWVWNEYNRDRLLRLSPVYQSRPSTVRVGGRPFMKDIPLFAPPLDASLTVAMIYEQYPAPVEIQAYIDHILAIPDARIIFLLRKDLARESQIQRYDLSRYEQIGRMRLTTTTDMTPEDWGSVSVVLGGISTLLEEMIAAGKPVAIIDMVATQSYDLVEEGLADWLPLNAVARMREIVHTDQATLHERQKRVQVTVSISDTFDYIFSHR